MKKKLGDLLIEAGLCNRLEIDNALQAQQIFGDHLGTNLLELGIVDDDTLAIFLSKQYGVPRATRQELASIPKEVVDLVPAPAAQRLCLLPLKKSDGRLIVAMMDPSDQRILDRVSKNLGMPVECRVATEIEIRYFLEVYYGIPREPRHIILMRQKFEDPEARGPNAQSAKILAAKLERRATSGHAIHHYFEAIGSLDKIPVRNPVGDLTRFDLTPELTFVLHYVDGFSSLREILMASVYPRIMTLRAIVYLADIQLISFEEA